jgi:hypothetical protein
MAVTLIKVAQYALYNDNITLDLLVDGFLRSNTVLQSVPRPETDDLRTLAVAASLIELFAMRSNQAPPQWTAAIGAVSRPIFLNSDAIESTWMRDRCLKEAPAPLRKRNIYSTENFLATI